MLKIKNTIKRISILACTLFIAISNMSLPVHAEDDNISIGKKIKYSYTGYNPDGSAIDAYGDHVAKIFVNGEIAFCVQPQEKLKIDANFTKSNYSHSQQNQMEAIAYAGWHMSQKTDDDYAATQFMIWEAMGFKFTSNSFDDYDAKKAEINDRLQQFKSLPSFDKTSLTLKVGESKTITDQKKVFQYYYHTSHSDGLTVKKSGNSLTITASANAPKNAKVKYQMVKESCVGTSILYASDTSQNVVPFKYPDPHETVINIKVQKYGHLELKKLDKQSGKVVKKAGVEFDVFKENGTKVATIATNRNGIASLKNLLFGKYYALEKTEPDKYFISNERINFEIKESDVTVQKSLANDQIRGRIELTKEDCEVGKRPQGDAKLFHAEYTLYAKEDILDPADDSVVYPAGTEIAKASIGENYKAAFDNLYLGKYKIKETKAPKGYLIDEREYEVNLTSDAYVKTVSSCDSVMKQAFKIAKFSDPDGSGGIKPALKGAEFTAILNRYVEQYGWDMALQIAQDPDDDRILDSEWDVLITSDEGTATSKPLPFGNYLVKETKTPGNPGDYETAPDFYVNIEKDSEIPMNYLYINDPEFTTIIAIVKKDAETHNIIELEGATFKIKCLEKNSMFEAGEYVNWWQWNPIPHTVDTFTTTENGTVMLPEELPIGLYQLEEIKAPNGYLLAKSGKPFRISGNGIHQQLGPDDTTIVTTITFDDTPVKGQVKLQKEAMLFQGYTSTKTKYGELFTPVYERGLLANVKFEIKAKTDIIGADGKLWYRAGQRVEVLTTDGETITTSSQLPIGTEGHNIYSIQEIETAEGYVLDDTIRYFRFDYADENTAIVDPTWLDENGNEIEADEILTLDNQHQTSITPIMKHMEISDNKDKTEA